MTDFTHYTSKEVRQMLHTLLTTTTAPIYDDSGEKLIAEPVYNTGIGLDTESTTISHADKKNKKIIVDHCFCYCYQISVGTDHYALYRNIKDCMNFFEQLYTVLQDKEWNYRAAKKPTPKCFVWVANLSHEWSFLKYEFYNRFEIKKCFAKSPRDVLYVDFGYFRLRECIGLFGHSLADIAKNWTKTQKLKGDLDYSLIRTEITPLTDTEKQYCINDVIILAEMHEAVIKAYRQENGGVVLPTTENGFLRMKLKENIRNDEDTTTSRVEWYNAENPTKPCKTNLSYICKLNKKMFVNKYQWNLCRDYAFTGGLCGSNIDKVGQTLHNIQCVDLTSDYPAQMIHQYFPDGKLTKLKPCDFDKAIRQENTDKYGNAAGKKPWFMLCLVSKMSSYSHHATFSKHKILNLVNPAYEKVYGKCKKLVVYNGKVRYVENAVVIINDIDLTAYSMIYDFEFTPITMYQFDKYKKIPAWLFKTLTDAYVKKSQLKKKIKEFEKNKKPIPPELQQEYNDAKVVCNSCYGVLSTKPSEAYDTFTEDGIFAASEAFNFDKMKLNCWLNPYIAFWITSYARRILMQFISEFPDQIIQYDTDSLYYDTASGQQLQQAIERYNSEITEKNKKIFKDHPEKELFYSLGTWDFETTYNNFLAMGAKKYIKQDTVNGIQTVIAGLPKYSIPAEIANEHIDKPFEYYNSLHKYMVTGGKDFAILIKHVYSNKFASVYNDSDVQYKQLITDHTGVQHEQLCGCYHAIIPIDFTLAMKYDYIQETIKVQRL